MVKEKVVLFVSHQIRHFQEHLLPIAEAAKESGYKVIIAANQEGDENLLSNHPFIRLLSKLACGSNMQGVEQKRSVREDSRTLPAEVEFTKKYIIENIPLDRGNVNPIKEMLLFWRILKIVMLYKPDVLHSFTMKPALYCTIIGRILGVNRVVVTFLGLGTLFISNTIILKIIKALFLLIIRMFSSLKTVFIVQNSDDKIFLSKFLPNSNIIAQCCVGVDSKVFYKLPFAKKDKTIFAMLGRMIRDKGVYEFLEAASALKQMDVEAEFWLIGDPDFGNRYCADMNIIKMHHDEGIIKYFGHVDDVVSIWKQADVCVLPSYREGFSRVLLEAASCNRAVITTDAPGGRDLVHHMEDGMLVKVGCSKELAEAMLYLIKNNAEIKRMAKNLCKIAVNQYNSRNIANIIIKLYNEREFGLGK